MTDIKHSPDLLLAMDCLWFHKVVLFSEPKPNSSTIPQIISQTPQTILHEQQISFSSETSLLPPQEDSLEDEVDDEDDEIDYSHMKQRRSSLNRISNITWSPCSSPVLRKTMSCRTLCELECDEVKGFMDLGFRFDKKNLSPRMMSMIPGLQRLGEYKDGVEENRIFTRVTDETKDGDIEEMNENDRVETVRPYLSEAWLIRRPDSPLINLRIPRVSTANDMKKHLKCWARTVASSVQLEY